MRPVPRLRRPAPAPVPECRPAQRLARGLEWAALARRPRGSKLVVDLTEAGDADTLGPDLLFMMGFAQAHGITGDA